jgi:WD40 repeat protein
VAVALWAGSTRSTSAGNGQANLAADGEPAEAEPVADPADSVLTRVMPGEDSAPLTAGEGKPLLVLDAGGHSATVKRALFTLDGSQVITASYDKTIRVWDVASGETVRTIRLPIGPGSEGAIDAAALSPDGKHVAVGGVPFGRGAHGVLIHLLDMDAGRVVGVIKGHKGSIADLAFSPDGRRLASASTDGTARVYELANGQTVQVFQGHRDRVSSLAFSPDGEHLLTGSADQTARIWSVATGNTEAELRGHQAPVESVACSRDGQTLATGSVDGTIRLWGSDGRPRQTCRWTQEQIQFTRLVFSRDGRELLYGGIGSTGRAGILDLASGKPRVQFTAHTNTVMHASLSSDGALAVSTGGDNHETFVLSTVDGAVVQKLVGKGKSVWGVGWSPDGKSVAWGNTNRGATHLAVSPLAQSFHLEDLDFAGPPGGDFRRARLSGAVDSLQAIDLLKMAIQQGGRTIHVFQTPARGERIYCFTLLDNEHAVVGGGYGLSYLVDLRTGKVVRHYRGHSGIVLAIAPSPDGRYFLTGSTDQTLCLWDPAKEEPILSLFTADTEWIAWTPQGYYVASANGERLMGWQINHGPEAVASFHPAARFHKSLYQPEVIRLLLRAANLEQALAQAGKERQQPVAAVTVGQVLPPLVAITAPAGPGPVQVNEARVQVRAAARSVGQNPVTALRLLVDGRPYRGRAGVRPVARPQPGEVRASWAVELDPGPHWLAVQAESAVSRALSPAVEVHCQGPKPSVQPRLFLLAVGVSAYPEPMQLHYAAADAQAMARAFREQSGSAFAQVEVHLLTDRQATRSGILAGLDWLAERMTARDVAVIFLSGHGTRDPGGNFYFVPVDVQPSNLESTCVSGEELKKRLEAMPGRLIAMFDACHSGAAAQPAGRRPGPLTDDLVRDLITEDYGVIVMCSSLGREFSIESPEVEHGFFTLAVVEGLSGRADFNHDHLVHFNELDLYASLRVPQLSQGIQHPVTAKPPTIRSFPLAKH